MCDTWSQPCPPVVSSKIHAETAGDKNQKRKAEAPSVHKDSKIPRVDGAAAPETTLEERLDSKLSKSPLSDTSSRAHPQTDPEDVLLLPAIWDSAVPPQRVADIHRTGAKCVPGGPTDPLHPGVGYHSTGLLRVKPGRGERTLSLSCSDKLARWTVLGFQGALLSHYLEEALYFSAVVVGKCPYSQEAMHRALVVR